MGSKSRPSAPEVPDPERTAAAQAAANKESAIAAANINMVNQYTPYGSLEFTERGTASDNTPQYSATQTLSPDQQQLYDLTNEAAQQFGETANTQLGAVSNQLAQPIDYGSLGPAPVANEETRQATQQAIMDRAQPFQDRQRDALETRLANQGFNRESEGFIDQMDQYNRSLNDFSLGADVQAGNEMSRMYGLERGQRDAAINEMAQQRQIPLNELNAMLTQSQVQGPSFITPPQSTIAPADIMGAEFGAFNGLMNQYQIDMGRNQQAKQGLYSLLGQGGQSGGMMFSDRRLKTNIICIGSLPNGLPVYRYNYIWGTPQIGLMADEVKQVHPHAVVNIMGYNAVNYREAVQ